MRDRSDITEELDLVKHELNAEKGRQRDAEQVLLARIESLEKDLQESQEDLQVAQNRLAVIRETCLN